MAGLTVQQLLRWLVYALPLIALVLFAMCFLELLLRFNEQRELIDMLLKIIKIDGELLRLAGM